MTASFAETLLQKIHQMEWDFIDHDAKWARVLYDFHAEEHDEMSVTEGQIVQLLMEPQPDWTFCRSAAAAAAEGDTCMGYIPTLYFEILQQTDLPQDIAAKIAILPQQNGNNNNSNSGGSNHHTALQFADNNHIDHCHTEDGVDDDFDDDYDDDYTETTSSYTYTGTATTTTTTTTVASVIGESNVVGRSGAGGEENDFDDDATCLDVNIVSDIDDDDDDDTELCMVEIDTDNEEDEESDITVLSSAEEISPRKSPRELHKEKNREKRREKRREKKGEKEEKKGEKEEDPKSTRLSLRAHFRHLTTTCELQELHHRADEHHRSIQQQQQQQQDETKHIEPGGEAVNKELTSVDKRTAVIREIVSTERHYVDCLNILDRHYIAPMRLLNMNKETSVLENRDFDLCFKPISVIKMVNTELLSCLQKLERGEVIDAESKFPVQTVGQLFIKTAPLLKMYHVYVNNYDNIMKRVRYLSKENERFSVFLNSADRKVRRESKLTLADLMIAPVQRLPRYNMLLRELMKHTDKEDEEREDLSKALSLMEGITAHINDNVRESENAKRMAELSRLINWKSFSESLIQSHRKLITEGTLKKVSIDRTGRQRFSRRNVFLFNDMLLICNKNNYYFHVKFLEAPLPWVFDRPDLRYFEIVSSKKNILFQARTMEEKEIWVKDITGCIQKLVSMHPEFKHTVQAPYEKFGGGHRTNSSSSLNSVLSSSGSNSGSSLKRKHTVKNLLGSIRKDKPSNSATKGDEVSDSESTTSTISPLTSPLTSPRQQGMLNMIGVRLPVPPALSPRELGASNSSGHVLPSMISPRKSPDPNPQTRARSSSLSGSSKVSKLLGIAEHPQIESEAAQPQEKPSKQSRLSVRQSKPPLMPPKPAKTSPDKSQTLPARHTGMQFAINQTELSKILERRRLASEPENENQS